MGAYQILIFFTLLAACLTQDVEEIDVKREEPISVASTEYVNPGDDITITCTILGSTPGMLLYWKKRQENEQMTQIGTNLHIDKKFNDTGRYSIETQPGMGDALYFKLKIMRILPEDAGEYGCYLPTTQQNAGYKRVVVRGQLETLKLYSLKYSGGTEELIEHTDGEPVFFYEGESRHFRCMANNSRPAANLQIKIGDEDLTQYFERSSELLIDGDPATDAGLLRISHQVNLTTAAGTPLNVSFEQNTYSLRCIASLGEGNDTSVTETSIKVVMKFKPKFTCNANPILVGEYSPNVAFKCSVRADPDLQGIKWTWNERSGVNRTLYQDQKRNLYSTSIVKGKTDDEHFVTFNVKRTYINTFRTYTMTANNDLGTSTLDLQLKLDRNAPIKSGSQGLVSSLVMIISTAAATWWLH